MTSMLLKPVVGVVASILSQYLDGVKSDTLGVNLWAGSVTLNNMKLQRDVLARFGLPLDIIASSVDIVEVSIPWSNIAGAPVVMKLSGVRLQCALEAGTSSRAAAATDSDPESMKRRAESSHTEKLAKLAKFEEDSAAAEDALVLERALSEEGTSSGPSFLQRLTNNILRNVVVIIETIDVQLVIPPLHASDAPSSIEFALDALHVDNATERWDPVAVGGCGAANTAPSGSFVNVRKLVYLNGLRAAVRTGAAEKPASLIEPITFSVRVHLLPAEDGPHQHAAAAAASQKAIITATLGAISVRCSNEQLLAVASLLAFQQQRSNILRFHRMRPRESVASNPRKWLQYAADCVRRIVMDERSRGSVERGLARIEQEYLALHKRQVRRICGTPVDWMQPLAAGSSDRFCYDLYERVLPLHRLMDLRRHARALVQLDYERVVPLETRRVLQEENAARIRAQLRPGWLSSAVSAPASAVGTAVGWVSSLLGRGSSAAAAAAPASPAHAGAPGDPMSASQANVLEPASPRPTAASAAARGGAPAAQRQRLLADPGGVRATLSFAGIGVTLLGASSEPIASCVVSNIDVAALLNDGTVEGPVDASVTVGGIRVSDETRARAFPVLASDRGTPALRVHAQHVVHVAATATTPATSSYRATADVQSLTVWHRAQFALALTRCLSLPSTFFMDSLNVVAARVVSQQVRTLHVVRSVTTRSAARPRVGVQRATRLVDALIGSERKPADAAARDDGSGARGGSAPASAGKPCHVTLRWGLPKLVVTEQNDVERGPALVLDLGTLKTTLSLTPAVTTVEGTWSDLQLYRAVAHSGLVATRIAQVLAPAQLDFSATVDTASAADARRRVRAKSTPLRFDVTPATASCLAGIGSSVSNFLAQVAALGEGVTLQDFEVSEPMFVDEDDESYLRSLKQLRSRPTGTQKPAGRRIATTRVVGGWRPCAITIKTEGVGAGNTVLAITHAPYSDMKQVSDTARVTQEEVVVCCRQRAAVLTEHPLLTDEHAVALCVPCVDVGAAAQTRGGDAPKNSGGPRQYVLIAFRAPTALDALKLQRRIREAMDRWTVAGAPPGDDNVDGEPARPAEAPVVAAREARDSAAQRDDGPTLLEAELTFGGIGIAIRHDSPTTVALTDGFDLSLEASTVRVRSGRAFTMADVLGGVLRVKHRQSELALVTLCDANHGVVTRAPNLLIDDIDARSLGARSQYSSRVHPRTGQPAGASVAFWTPPLELLVSHAAVRSGIAVAAAFSDAVADELEMRRKTQRTTSVFFYEAASSSAAEAERERGRAPRDAASAAAGDCAVAEADLLVDAHVGGLIAALVVPPRSRHRDDLVSHPPLPAAAWVTTLRFVILGVSAKLRACGDDVAAEVTVADIAVLDAVLKGRVLGRADGSHAAHLLTMSVALDGSRRRHVEARLAAYEGVVDVALLQGWLPLLAPARFLPKTATLAESASHSADDDDAADADETRSHVQRVFVEMLPDTAATACATAVDAYLLLRARRTAGTVQAAQSRSVAASILQMHRDRQQAGSAPVTVAFSMDGVTLALTDHTHAAFSAALHRTDFEWSSTWRPKAGPAPASSDDAALDQLQSMKIIVSSIRASTGEAHLNPVLRECELECAVESLNGRRTAMLMRVKRIFGGIEAVHLLSFGALARAVAALRRRVRTVFGGNVMAAHEPAAPSVVTPAVAQPPAAVAEAGATTTLSVRSVVLYAGHAERTVVALHVDALEVDNTGRSAAPNPVAATTRRGKQIVPVNAPVPDGTEWRVRQCVIGVTRRLSVVDLQKGLQLCTCPAEHVVLRLALTAQLSLSDADTRLQLAWDAEPDGRASSVVCFPLHDLALDASEWLTPVNIQGVVDDIANADRACVARARPRLGEQDGAMETCGRSESAFAATSSCRGTEDGEPVAEAAAEPSPDGDAATVPPTAAEVASGAASAATTFVLESSGPFPLVRVTAADHSIAIGVAGTRNGAFAVGSSRCAIHEVFVLVNDAELLRASGIHFELKQRAANRVVASVSAVRASVSSRAVCALQDVIDTVGDIELLPMFRPGLWVIDGGFCCATAPGSDAPDLAWVAQFNVPAPQAPGVLTLRGMHPRNERDGVRPRPVVICLPLHHERIQIALAQRADDTVTAQIIVDDGACVVLHGPNAAAVYERVQELLTAQCDAALKDRAQRTPAPPDSAAEEKPSEPPQPPVLAVSAPAPTCAADAAPAATTMISFAVAVREISVLVAERGSRPLALTVRELACASDCTTIQASFDTLALQLQDIPLMRINQLSVRTADSGIVLARDPSLSLDLRAAELRDIVAIASALTVVSPNVASLGSAPKTKPPQPPTVPASRSAIIRGSISVSLKLALGDTTCFGFETRTALDERADAAHGLASSQCVRAASMRLSFQGAAEHVDLLKLTEMALVVSPAFDDVTFSAQSLDLAACPEAIEGALAFQEFIARHAVASAADAVGASLFVGKAHFQGGLGRFLGKRKGRTKTLFDASLALSWNASALLASPALDTADAAPTQAAPPLVVRATLAHITVSTHPICVGLSDVSAVVDGHNITCSVPSLSVSCAAAAKGAGDDVRKPRDDELLNVQLLEFRHELLSLARPDNNDAAQLQRSVTFAVGAVHGRYDYDAHTRLLHDIAARYAAAASLHPQSRRHGATPERRKHVKSPSGSTASALTSRQQTLAAASITAGSDALSSPTVDGDDLHLTPLEEIAVDLAVSNVCLGVAKVHPADAGVYLCEVAKIAVQVTALRGGDAEGVTVQRAKLGTLRLRVLRAPASAPADAKEIVSYEAVDVAEYTRQNKAGFLELGANVGALTVNVTPEVLQLLTAVAASAAHTETDLFVAAEAGARQSPTAAEGGDARAAAAPLRALLYVVGPQISITVLDRLQCTCCVSQTFLEFNGCVANSRAKFTASLEIQPIVSLDECLLDKGPHLAGFLDAPVVAPIVWLEVDAAMSTQSTALDMRRFGVDTSQVPGLVRDKLRPLLGPAVDAFIGGHQRVSLSNLSVMMTTRRVDAESMSDFAMPSLQVDHLAAQVESLTARLRLGLALGTIPATVHLHLRAFQLSLDARAGMNVALEHVDALLCDAAWAYSPYVQVPVVRVRARTRQRLARAIRIWDEIQVEAKRRGAPQQRPSGAASPRLFDTEALWARCDPRAAGAAFAVQVRRVQAAADVSGLLHAASRRCSVVATVEGVQTASAGGIALRVASVDAATLEASLGSEIELPSADGMSSPADDGRPWGIAVQQRRAQGVDLVRTRVAVDGCTWSPASQRVEARGATLLLDADNVTLLLALAAKYKAWSLHERVWSAQPFIARERIHEDRDGWRRIRRKIAHLLRNRPIRAPAQAVTAREAPGPSVAVVRTSIGNLISALEAYDAARGEASVAATDAVNELIRKLHYLDQGVLSFINDAHWDQLVRETMTEHMAATASRTATIGPSSPEPDAASPSGEASTTTAVTFARVEIKALLREGQRSARHGVPSPSAPAPHVAAQVCDMRLSLTAAATVVQARSVTVDDETGLSSFRAILRLTPAMDDAAADALRFEMNATSSIIDLGRTKVVASSALADTLYGLVRVHEGLAALPLPPRRAQEPPPATPDVAWQSNPNEPWRVRIAALRALLPASYAHPCGTNDALVLDATGCDLFAAPPLETAAPHNASVMFVRAAYLMVDVVAVDAAAPATAYFEESDAQRPFAEICDSAEIRMQYDLTPTTVTSRIPQQIGIRCPSDAGAVTIHMSMSKLSRLMRCVGVVMLDWVEQPCYLARYPESLRWEHANVDVLGPWFLPTGPVSSENTSWRAATAALPEQLAQYVYPAWRIRFDDVEELPFHMHAGTLCSVCAGARVAELLAPFGVDLPEADIARVIGYAVPQDGLRPFDRSAPSVGYFFIAVRCASERAAQQLLQDLTALVDDQRRSPTVYVHAQSPARLNQLFRFDFAGVTKLYSYLRDPERDPCVGIVEMHAFAYTQRGRACDQVFDVDAEKVVVRTCSSDGTVDTDPLLVVELKRPGGACFPRGATRFPYSNEDETEADAGSIIPFVRYNAVNSSTSPRFTGQLLAGGSIVAPTVHVGLYKCGLRGGFDRYYGYWMNSLIEMMDANSNMWQWVYLEQGGPQVPLSQPAWCMPWDIHFDTLHVNMFVPHRSSPVLSGTLRDFEYTFTNTYGVLFENRIAIGDIGLSSDGVDVLVGTGVQLSEEAAEHARFQLCAWAPTPGTPPGPVRDASPRGPPLLAARAPWLVLRSQSNLAHRTYATSGSATCASRLEVLLGRTHIALPEDPKPFVRIARLRNLLYEYSVVRFQQSNAALATGERTASLDEQQQQ